MSEVSPVVFVVDQDASVRESVDALLQVSGVRVEGFPSARDFLAQARPMTPCCLVLDVNLPDMDAFELQSQVVKERAEMQVIFIGNGCDIYTAVRAMKAGAVEFLCKPFADRVLLRAVGEAIQSSCAAIAHQAAVGALRARHESLTPREREVMALVAGGRLNKEVGGTLGISEITVKAHRGRVMRKMQAASFAHLVDMARRLGMPSLPRRLTLSAH